MFIRKNISGTRHEIKILLTYAEYIDLSNKLRCVTIPDDNSIDGNGYFIRSLYFDDIRNSAYITKVEGSDNRKKYRIRCYNISNDVIKFECKRKYKDRIAKTSFSITYEEYLKIMEGDTSFLTDINHPLAKEVYAEIVSNGLRPSVIVDYDREVFLHPLSNTRLTFDKNLRAGIDSFDIFDKDVCTLPIFENGSVIFEVKYDDYIPRSIVDIIASSRGVKMSLSKYCMCKDKLLEVKKYDN